MRWDMVANETLGAALATPMMSAAVDLGEKSLGRYHVEADRRSKVASVRESVHLVTQDPIERRA